MNTKAQTKIVYGIIGILVLLGVGTLILTPEQLAKSHTCTSNNVTGIFEKFSATNVTAYWRVNDTLKQSVCTKGKWITTNEWLKIHNLTTKDITVNTVVPSNITEDYFLIVNAGDTITVNESTTISINNVKYNVTFIPRTITKCICDKKTGCVIRECLT